MKRSLKFHFFEEVDSTQELAKKLVKDSDKLHVIVAFSQTHGKGTRGKSWISPKESGIYVTFAFELGHLNFLPTLSHLAACSVCELLKSINPKIKWPNDILVKDKKISGVLTEVSSHHVYVGVGINVKKSKSFDLVDQPYTCLEDYKKSLDLNALIEQLSTIFLDLLEKWEHHGFNAIKAIYCQFFVFMGQSVIVDTNQGLLKGDLIDFSSQGYPILKLGSEIKTIEHAIHINQF